MPTVRESFLLPSRNWGGQISTLLSPGMLEEFILPAHKEASGFWKDNGIEAIDVSSKMYVPQN